jgi:hypothetical protein
MITMSNRVVTLLALVTIGFSLRAATITTLLNGSSAVVIGTASNEAQSGNQILFNLNVERVFTGPIQAGQIVQVRTPSLARNQVRLSGKTGYRGIWFLKDSSSLGWECAQAWHQGNGSVGLVFFRYPVGTGLLPSALSYDAASTSVADQLLLEMAAGDFDGHPSLLVDASGDMSSPAVGIALRYLARSRASEQAQIGIAALLGHGDIPTLLDTESMAAGLPATAGGTNYIANAIGNSHFADPTAVASLGRIATTQSNPILVRTQAARALSTTHTAAAVPWLGALLSDTSAQLRVTAATGLSFFVGGVGVPTPETMPTLSHLNQRQPSAYRTADTDKHIGFGAGDESKFVDYWISWWAQHPELHAKN